jgi:hypothetical protein
MCSFDDTCAVARVLRRGRRVCLKWSARVHSWCERVLQRVKIIMIGIMNDIAEADGGFVQK